MDDINNRILEELVAIRKLLTIFSQDKLAGFNEHIKEKYLKTEQRQKMYDLFDGTKSLKDISSEVGTSSEAVRQFAVQMEKDGLVECITVNKVKCYKRLF